MTVPNAPTPVVPGGGAGVAVPDTDYPANLTNQNYLTDINPLAPPAQKTLVYSPDVRIWIAHGSKQYDVSKDIIAVAIQRNENAVSTLVFKLANKHDGRKKLRYMQTFERMDRVTCFMKRTDWIQVFSGYLDSVPYLQLYPGTVTFRASCTLKRCLHTWWDPGLAASRAIFDQPAAHQQEVKDGEYSMDSGSGSLLRNFLVKVGGWNPQHVHVQQFPNTYFIFMQQQLKKVGKGTDEAAREFRRLLLGDGDVSGGRGSSAGRQLNISRGSYPTGQAERKKEVIRCVDDMGMGPDTRSINTGQAVGDAASQAQDERDEQAWVGTEEAGRNLEEEGKKSDAAIHCFMVIAVESQWMMYSNPSVPGSEKVQGNDGPPATGGDHDSVGLYQQRQQGWGTLEQRMNPYASTHMFLTRLKDFNWRNMERGEACAEVQQPAAQYRYKYAEFEAAAEEEVRNLRGNRAPKTGANATDARDNIPIVNQPLPTGTAGAVDTVVNTAKDAAETPNIDGAQNLTREAAQTAARPEFDSQGAILYGMSQQGKPYVYGASGPDTYDCLARGTLITTARGQVPIECVTTDDQVLTRKGYRRVLRAWKVRDDAPTVELTVDGHTLRGTPDHRVWTENRGWTPLAGINEFDSLLSCHIDPSNGYVFSAVSPSWEGREETTVVETADISRSARRVEVETSGVGPKGLSSKRLPTTAIQTRTGRVIVTTSSAKDECSMLLSGNITMDDPCLTGTKSTMPITTPSIMIRQTLSAKRSRSIGGRVRPIADCTLTLAPCAASSSRHTRRRSAPTDSARASISTSSTTIVEGPNAAVYDLSVEGEHEFFANHVLVHNCSSFTQWAYRSIGINIGRDTHAQAASGTVISPAMIQPGDLIQPHSDHVVMYLGPGQMIHAPQTGDVVRVAPLPPDYLTSGTVYHYPPAEYGGPGPAFFNPSPPGPGAAPSTVVGGPGGNSTDVGSTEPIARNLFTYMFQQGDFMDETSALFGNTPGTKEKAFLNDQSMMHMVISMATAGLRNFCSAPNGDFVAYYPDYFGMDGKRAVLKLEDIEMKNVQIDLNDDALSTHVYVAGSPTPINTQYLGWYTSKGFATVENEWLFARMRMAAPQLPGETMTRGTEIMKRFGVRPMINNMAMVQSGPMEVLMAIKIFMEQWALQYATQVELTFMPELFPGMRIELVGHGLQVYVSQVTHQGDFESGFSTTATIMAPSNPNFGKIVSALVDSVNQNRTDLMDILGDASTWFF